MSSLHELDIDEMPRGTGGVGATDAIRRVLHQSGLNANIALYDEALAEYQNGDFAAAAERLHMLLTLDPTDAEAALLLGKVYAKRKMWQEALRWLDNARDNGAILQAGLRDWVESEHRKQVAGDEELRTRLASRDRSEVKKLRAEARTLRTDNANLEAQVEELQRRVRIWSTATALIGGAGAALLFAAFLFGGGDAGEAAPEQTVQALAAETPAEAAPAAAPAVAEQPAPAAPAAAEKPAPAPKPAAAPAVSTGTMELIGMHKVRRGDTLGAISKKYYGTSAYWPKIRDANADVLHGGIALRPGMKLRIPDVK